MIRRNRFIVPLGVVLLILVVGYIYISRAMAYSKAVSQIEAGEYLKAFDAFEALGSYKSSRAYAKQAYYLQGQAYLEQGEYDKAYSIFWELGSYKNSEKMLKELEEQRKASSYKEGIGALESGEYDKAYSIFWELGSYKNSEKMLKELEEHLNKTFTIPGSEGVQLKMRLIPAGTFTMGSPESEQDRNSNEGPQHQVTITKPFYMGIYEVTQAQWAAVRGTRPSHFSYKENNPVETVSWDDCQRFIQKLNTMGIGTFRLPTEAEWEYACRAGSTKRFPWGDDPNYSLLEQYAWYIYDVEELTHAVGQKKPNKWGLYDMHGNVYEWCSDWYADINSTTAQTDPRGPNSGSYHIVRGGCWLSRKEELRSACRGGAMPTTFNEFVGLRLVREY